MLITDEELEKFKKIAINATPGPWYFDGCSVTDTSGKNCIINNFDECFVTRDSDCQFIGTMNPATILNLIEDLQKARSDSRKFLKERDWLAKYLEYNNGPDMRISSYEYIAQAKKATGNTE